MSDYMKNPPYSATQQQTNWINIIHGTHDQICGCDDVLKHILKAFAENNNKQVTEKKLKEIKWHLTGEEDGDPTGEVEDVLDGVDLEQLFAGDDDEPTEGPSG